MMTLGLQNAVHVEVPAGAVQLPQNLLGKKNLNPEIAYKPLPRPRESDIMPPSARTSTKRSPLPHRAFPPSAPHGSRCVLALCRLGLTSPQWQSTDSIAIGPLSSDVAVTVEAPSV